MIVVVVVRADDGVDHVVDDVGGGPALAEADPVVEAAERAADERR